MSVTLKDIAKMANVSVATVSLVLNKRASRISKSKQEEIIKLAKQYGYQVNLTARSLVTNKSKILGLILPDLENLFFSSLAQKLERTVRKKGYALFILSSNENTNDDLWLIDHLVSRGVDGIFICPANNSLKSQDFIDKLDSLKIPFVMIDRVIDDKAYNKVSFDNEWGSYEAVRYLIENGHKKIGCIAPPNSRINGHLRLSGYYKALLDNNIKVDDGLIVEGDYKFMSGYHGAKKLIEEKKVKAVFSCNDMMTLGLLRYVSEKKLKVPKELSIVSYDNVLDFFAINTGITSIEQDVLLLVKSSSEIMFECINKGMDVPSREVIYKPKMFIKGSVLNLLK